MALYPFCIVSDVEAIVRQQHPDTAYSATTKPTLASVNAFMDETTSHIISICDTNGYDTDNFHEASTTATGEGGATIASDATTILVASSTGFAVGDIAKLDGTKAAVTTTVFVNVTEITSGVQISITAPGESLTGGATISVVNTAMRLLRDICAVGSAAKAVEAGFDSISKNMSPFAEALWARYYGSEKTQWGLWAIANIESFLTGATRETGAIARSTIHSYREQNTDYQDDQWFERDTEF